MAIRASRILRFVLPWAMLLGFGGCFFSGLIDLAPFPCATDGTCPDTFTCLQGLGCTPLVDCNLMQQSCDSDSKCAVVLDSAGQSQIACVNATGTRALGESCERSAVGIDDCAAALFCNAGLSPDGKFVCRRYCDASETSAACGQGEACAQPFSLDYGICVPRCEPGDGTCNAASTCQPAGDGRFACNADGMLTEWESCDENHTCGHGLACYGVCLASCSNRVPCPVDESCVGPAVGLCQCDFFSSRCPSGQSCKAGKSGAAYYGSCEADGSRTLGSSCSANTDCTANLMCLNDVCVAQCDDSRPCTRGSCHVLTGTARNGGACY
jgi:hypothetical protein